jgi:hypothetical protein
VATLISTRTKIVPHKPLAEMRPHIRGCDQGSSSVDFRDNPSSKHPTVRMSANNPKKSTCLSLVQRGREQTSSGSGISTLIKTDTIDTARMGTCNQSQISGQSSRTQGSLLLAWNKNTDLLTMESLSYDPQIIQKVNLPTKPVIEPPSQWSTKASASPKEARKWIKGCMYG